MVPTVCRTSSIRLLCVYYFFLAVVIIGYETTATARWTLLFIACAFFNNTITIAVRGFHVRLMGCYHPPSIIFDGAATAAAFADEFGAQVARKRQQYCAGLTCLRFLDRLKGCAQQLPR